VDRHPLQVVDGSCLVWISKENVFCGAQVAVGVRFALDKLVHVTLELQVRSLEGFVPSPVLNLPPFL
jgi:hypothetical protein